MEKLRVGIIGAGFIGRQHIEAVGRIPGAEIVAAADQNLEMVRSLSEDSFIPHCTSNYHEILDNPDIDVVHICTPSNTHFEMSKEALLKGKHVYCEKPLCLDTKESEELCRIAKESGLAHGIDLNYRFNAAVQEMHHRVKSGDIGRVLTVHGEYLQDWMLFESDYDWRVNPKIGGASRAVADIGSHFFDTMQFILGTRVKRIYSKFIKAYESRTHSLNDNATTYAKVLGTVVEEVEVNTEDAAFIIAEMEDGVPAFINISQICAGHKNGLGINVSGTKMSLEWYQENPDKLIVGHRNTPNEYIFLGAQNISPAASRFLPLPAGHPCGWVDALKNAINEFYIYIRTGKYLNRKVNYPTFEDGHQIMQLIEACIQSDKTGSWIQLPGFGE